MNLNQLESFICICECGTITKAADHLFITQSALSQQLLHLEKELETQLFIRNGNKISLTDSGRILLSRARNMLLEYHNAISEMQIAKEKNELTLVVTKAKSFITLSYLLPGFMNLHPNIHVHIKEVDSYEVEKHLLNGEGDIGFCYNSSDTKLTYYLIHKEPILLALPPKSPLIAKAYNVLSSKYPHISFDAIKDSPFIIGTSGYLKEYTQELFSLHNTPLNVVLETSNPGLVHLLVAANIGSAFIGEVSTWIEPTQLDKPVFCLLEGYEDRSLNVAIAHNNKKYITLAMRQFIRYAQNFFSYSSLNTTSNQA